MSKISFCAALVLSALLALPVAAQSTDHDHHHDHPDAAGIEAPAQDGWKLHHHTVLTLANSNQSGPRGGEKTFVTGMYMVQASRAINTSTNIKLSLMLSPDPFMGKAGYPLLLQAGETADGVTPLVDAQHPHDLFMDMSATLTHRFSDDLSGYVKAGWPSEVTFGPTTFMHRASGERLPVAPLTHHWFDSTHVSMGMVAAGVSKGPLTFEATRFTGREPDEKRFDLESPRLDSTAARVTWQMIPNVRAQASWMRQTGPEFISPDEDVLKLSASIEAHVAGIDTTFAFGRKQHPGSDHKPNDAWLAEATWPVAPQWYVLGRYERVRTHELGPDDYWVAKSQLGAMRDFTLTDNAKLGVGLVRQWNDVPTALEASYGPKRDGLFGFVTLNLMSGAM